MKRFASGSEHSCANVEGMLYRAKDRNQGTSGSIRVGRTLVEERKRRREKVEFKRNG